MASDGSGRAVIPFDSLVDGFPTRVEVDGVAVCVVRVGDGLYAVGDRCSHAEVSLAEGEVDPDTLTVECPKHGSAFSLETGAPLSLPATKPVPIFAVRREGDDVVVEER